jgi:hypothetical protein
MNADGFRIIIDSIGILAAEWQGYLAFGSAPSTDTQEWRGSYPPARLTANPSVMYAPCQ